MSKGYNLRDWEQRGNTYYYSVDEWEYLIRRLPTGEWGQYERRTGDTGWDLIGCAQSPEAVVKFG